MHRLTPAWSAWFISKGLIYFSIPWLHFRGRTSSPSCTVALKPHSLMRISGQLKFFTGIDLSVQLGKLRPRPACSRMEQSNGIGFRQLTPEPMLPSLYWTWWSGAAAVYLPWVLTDGRPWYRIRSLCGNLVLVILAGESQAGHGY